MALARDMSTAQLAFGVEGVSLDQFLVIRYRGSEGLCQLYRFEIELASSESSVTFDDIVGKPAALSIANKYGHRWFHGIVSRFEMTGETVGQTYYRAELVPGLWLLTHRYNSRIFQQKSIKDIITQVITDGGIESDRFDVNGLTRTYPALEYCCQYRETDYNFICRLMEQEGIRWYFEQSQEGAKLILSDVDTYATIEGKAELPYHAPTGMNVPEEHVFRLRIGQCVRPGAVVLNDFNFKNPQLNLQSKADSGRDTGLEFSDFPGEYVEQGQGGDIAALRAKEFESGRVSGFGQSNSPRLAVGRTFKLVEHPSEPVNASYLITSMTHQGKQATTRTSTGSNGQSSILDARSRQNLIQAQRNDNPAIRELADALLQVVSRFRAGDQTAHRALTEWLYHAGQVSKDLPSVAGASGGDPLEALAIPNLIGDIEHMNIVDVDAPVYECRFGYMPAEVPYRPPRITPWPVVRGTQTARVVGPSGEEIHTDEYGRVKVQFDWDREGKFDENSSCWIRVSQGMAGGQYGMMFLPRIGQEVVVDYLEGNIDKPIIVGRVYNADHMPPYPLPEEKTKSVIKTHSSKGGGGNNEIRFEDLKGKEQLFIQAQRQMDTRVKASHFHTIGGDYHVKVGKEFRELTKGAKHVHVEGELLTLVGEDESRINLTNYSQRIDEVRLITVHGNVGDDFKANHLKKVGQTYVCNAGSILLEAKQAIELKCGGSSIVLTPAAIFIQGGPVVNINSGAGPGVVAAGGSETFLPSVAEDPSEADSSEPGKDTTYGGGGEITPGEVPENIPGWEPEDLEPPVRTISLEFQVVDAEENPVPNEAYILHKPDGTTEPGTTDGEGVVRLVDVEPGDYKIQLPDRYDMEWKFLRVEDPASGGTGSQEASPDGS